MRAARTPIVSLALALLSACSGGPADAADLRGAIDPHLAELAAYDRWARRLALGDSAFRSEEALREAAFAPLRDERSVAAAWVEREGPDGHALRYPDGAPALPPDGWVTVRTEELGELEVQRAALRIGEETTPCLLIRRSAPAPRDATLHVTLAFASSS
jgi:hypothetical protein